MKCIELYITKSIRSFISDKDTGKNKYNISNWSWDFKRLDNYKAARIHRATFRTAWRRKPHSLFGDHNNQKLLYISSWPTNCDHSISYPHKCNHSYFGGSGCGGALSGRTHAHTLQICGQSGKRNQKKQENNGIGWSKK